MNTQVEVSASKTSPKSISVVIAFAGVVVSVTAGLFIAGMANTLQVLVVAFGVTAFLVTFARLEWGVAVMLFVLYTQAYIIVGERYGVTNVVQGLIMLLVLSMGTRWIVYNHEIPQGWMRPLFLVAFYCMVGLISVLYAVDPAVAYYIEVELLKSGIIALIIAVVLRNEKSFHLAIWVLLAVGIFLGTLSIFQFVTGTYSNDYGGYAVAALQNIAGQSDDYRLGGPLQDPNYYAQLMLVLVPLALDRLWNEKQSILRVLAAWAFIACTFTVLLTYSRGGFLSMMAVVIAMLAVFHRGQLRYLLVVLIVGLFLVNVLPSKFTERISTLTELIPSLSSSNGGVRDSSIRGRTSEAIVALQMFADYPILGVGLGNYPGLYQKYSQRLGIDARSEVRQAHSLYLEVAAETGLLGLFSFGLLLWVVLKSMWKAQRSLARAGLTSVSNMVAAYAFGFLGYLLAAIFIHSAYPRNFWVLAGIALSIPRMAEIELETAEEARRNRPFSIERSGISQNRK
ncbi:MAG: O-antigen ligase family protein [Anaerolineales bacterium]|nr:O-antigen ligase family protein [Anaerolineales bacterium]